MDSESDEIIVNHCPECEQDIDVTLLSPYSKVTCPHCDETVRVRTRLGQYEINSPLGEGGMSQVFEAEDVTLGRKVALKILHQELSLDSKLTQMFEREAKLTASINHPNVVKVYTVGYEKGYFYIAMELVDAVSVDQIIAEHGALSEEKVLQMAYDVVSGLKAAYQLNLIHRDIKPGNMLVTKDGTAKLVDFGLAVVQGGADENEDIWATPFYVPPEKLVREPDTYLGDIYALGATCYHALAGVPPFVANTNSLEELIEIKSKGVDLKAAAPHASLPTVKLIEQMMAYSARDRPASYDLVLQRIQARQREIGALPQANTHYTKSERKGILVPVGIGVVAGAALGLLFQSFGRKSSNEMSGLFPDSGDRVISAEEKEAAGKMLEGRSAMARGRFSEARRIFSELEGNKNFSQPTRAWNTFSQGLTELLIGNEKAARSSFAALQTQTGFEKKQKSYREFFEKMGKILSNPLPVLRSDVAVDAESFESIALLAAGLKNWELGQFKEANVFFTDFLSVKSPSSEPWIGDMKQFVGSYQKDLKVLEGLPNPSRRMDRSTLRDVKSKLEDAAESIQKRSMKRLVQERIARADEFLSRPRDPEPSPPTGNPGLSMEWTEAEKAEAMKIQTLVDAFPDYKTTYLFSGAILKLEEIKAETPKGIALRQDLIDGYKAAEKFIPGLAARLDRGNYSGMIRRKKGVPLDAAVTAATPEVFTVDLGFGPNEVGIDQFDPGWLVEAAETTLGDPSESNLPELKEAFWFANVCGLRAEANRVAVKIINLDRNFKDEGQRFRKITFAQAGTE